MSFQRLFQLQEPVVIQRGHICVVLTRRSAGSAEELAPKLFVGQVYKYIAAIVRWW